MTRFAPVLLTVALAAATLARPSCAAIDPNPPDPHRGGASMTASLSPNPPDPHREGKPSA